jgi:hypothetical protein
MPNQNKHNFFQMFKADMRSFQPAVRFRKPVSQTLPFAGVQDAAIEMYLILLQIKSNEDNRDAGLYVTHSKRFKNMC